eukprot:6400278-Lingulodinium_polyedra.AAC.1
MDLFEFGHLKGVFFQRTMKERLPAMVGATVADHSACALCDLTGEAFFISIKGIKGIKGTMAFTVIAGGGLY